MKPYPLPALTIGLDVVSSEMGLPKGAVRQAHNIIIRNNGDFERRPGHDLKVALPNLHSLWQSPAQTRVMGAADDTLYTIDPASGAYAPLFVGLPPDEPVEYCDVNADVYFACGGYLRRVDPASNVTRPGVMELMGSRPTITPGRGTLQSGRYGVAYSVFTASGEESALSSLSFITITTGGIALAGLQSIPGVTHIGIYVTPTNGDKLYRYAKIAVAISTTITDNVGVDRGMPSTRGFCQMMPGGSIPRLFNGQLHVVSADRRWVYISEPLDYGISSMRGGWLTFNRTINIYEPVRDGIFVGFRESTIFLRGDKPTLYTQVDAANHGAVRGTAAVVPADYFNPDLVPDRSTPVTCWLSDVGMVIGHPDGSLAYPQAGRIRMDAGAFGRSLFMQQRGLKQAAFCLENMTMGVGGAVDTTI